MTNQRMDYRHTFPAGERLRVDLHSATAHATLAGEVTDLSVGGMRVRLESPAPVLPLGERWTAAFTLPGGGPPLRIPVSVAHVRTEGATVGCGLRFLRLADPSADEARERQLWLFLMEEQRRTIKAGKKPRRSAAPAHGGA